MRDGILENQKIRTELSNRQDMAVDAELNANSGGVTVAPVRSALVIVSLLD